MQSRSEKGGGSFTGIKLLLCENPLPPLEEAIAAAQAELPRSLLERYSRTCFLVDEAFIGLAGQPVASLVPEHPNLLVTRTLSKAHSLAGFRVGYALLPEAVADDLNAHNDAYPLARPSEAAAIAPLEHEDRIRARAQTLRAWTQGLAAELRAMGVRTFPTETYFFLADFAPRDAGELARGLAARGILVKPLGDARLGPGYMRITTALPEDNARFFAALRELL
jgi:histidinol-phosphate aminotransferase